MKVTRSLSLLFIGMMIFTSLMVAIPSDMVGDAEAALPFSSDKVTYGIFVLPNAITNTTLAVSGGATGGTHLEGIGWLYTKLAAHSSCKFLTYAEIQSGNGGVDVTVFWEPKFITNSTLTVFKNYIANHNVVLISGREPFMTNENGWKRDQATGDMFAIESYFGIKKVDVVRDTRDATNTDNRVIVRADFGNWTEGEIYNYPKNKFQWSHAMYVNDTLDGAYPLLSLTSPAGYLGPNHVVVGREDGVYKRAIVTVGYVPTSAENDIYFNACKWAGSDEGFGITMWPNGKSIATYQRMDDTTQESVVRLADEMGVPIAFFANTALSGNIEANASAYLNNSDMLAYIGMHGNNHTLPFWQTGTTAQFVSSIQANRAFVEQFVDYDVDIFVSPAHYSQDELMKAMDPAGVSANVGVQPYANDYTAFWPMMDLPLLPYQYVYSDNTGRTSAYLWQQKGETDSFLKKSGSTYYGVGTTTLDNIYRYGDAAIYSRMTHYYDHATFSDFETYMTAFWPTFLKNTDLWLATPDMILDQYKSRQNLDFMVSGDAVTVKNTNAYTVYGAGMNYRVEGDMLKDATILVDGERTDNVLYSNGKVQFWADSIGPGQQVTFTISDYTDGPYSVFIDYFGDESPRLGTKTYRFGNNYDQPVSINFPSVCLAFVDGTSKIYSNRTSVEAGAKSAGGDLCVQVETTYIEIFVSSYTPKLDSAITWSASWTGYGEHTFTVYGLRESNAYDIKMDNEMLKSSVKSSSDGELTFSYSGNGSAHTFIIIDNSMDESIGSIFVFVVPVMVITVIVTSVTMLFRRG